MAPLSSPGDEAGVVVVRVHHGLRDERLPIVVSWHACLSRVSGRFYDSQDLRAPGFVVVYTWEERATFDQSVQFVLLETVTSSCAAACFLE